MTDTFLPMTRTEMERRGWSEIDVLLVTGDAYFDHPSHGAAVIGRILEARGYRVGIIARPNWRATTDFTALGRPTLFAGVTAGAVDSQLNNYTAALKKRHSDEYAPGGIGGGRPDFATLVYANRLREAFGGLPIVLGGIEASTRRFAYFEPIKKKIRRSVLIDSRADLLVHGMGERAAIDIAGAIGRGESVRGIAGTAWVARGDTFQPQDADIQLPLYDAIAKEPHLLVEQQKSVEIATGPGAARRVLQQYQEGWVVCEPSVSMSTEELDAIYELPFRREAHPRYTESIPAFEMIRWSVVSHRGCPGGCSFCALAMHQGRAVTPRSQVSILTEIRQLTGHKDFKGTITDVGGPTANAFASTIRSIEKCRRCSRSSCYHPRICANLNTDHGELLELLERASRIPGVRHLFLASGVRFDLALKDPRFIRDLAEKYTGGHLKVAPEHVAPDVLNRMRKPSIEVFEEFERKFLEHSKHAGKEQYLVPYFIAGFPGCGSKGSEAVRRWLDQRGQRLRQVQGYMPLPGTMGAAYYAAAKDEKGNEIFVSDPAEANRQKQQMVQPTEGKRSVPSKRSRRPRRGQRR